MKIAILGGGSWGTALALHLARNDHQIKVWEFNREQAAEMQKKRICPLLPKVMLPESIFISSKMEEVVFAAELVLIAVPSEHVEATIKTAANFLKDQPVIICSKGLSKEGKLLSDVVKVKGEVYCLYGPTHAEEVSKDMFCGIVLAGGKGKERLKSIIESKNMKVELSDDLIGVQVGAAFKNIIALFVGVLEGAGYGDNARAFIIDKGLAEIKQIGVKLGAKEVTFYGLAGIGDIIVTSFSRHSRNKYLGEQIGKGKKLDDILQEMKMVAEGVNTLKTALVMEKKLDLHLPLIRGLDRIIHQNFSIEEVLHNL
ncbi:MAG: NAD(P)H-dependent glycerol-3-phosphate dehydrogenase [Candidatus Woesearchaeota archaeon]